ncbi:hypothetical protein ACFLT2_03375 [Acidobacteriota bacterium]
MKTKLSVLLLSLVVCLCAFAILAQGEEEEFQFVLVEELEANVNMINQYNEVLTELVSLCKKHNFPYSWSTWGSDDFHYFFFYSIKDYSDIAGIEKAQQEIFKKIGEAKYQELLEKALPAIVNFKHYVYRALPEQTFIPDNPRLKDEEKKFMTWDIFWPDVLKEQELLETGKEWVALLKAKNVDYESYAFAGDIGTERPVYLIVEFGKDINDYWTHSEKMQELQGEEGRKLGQRDMAMTLKRRWMNFWFQPELSYMPEEK